MKLWVLFLPIYKLRLLLNLLRYLDLTKDKTPIFTSSHFDLDYQLEIN